MANKVPDGKSSNDKLKREDKIDKFDFVEKTISWKADFITMKK